MIRGDAEEVLTDDELFDIEEENLSEGDEIAKIFKIEIDIFDFETPLCEAFKEFNYLLKIDVDILIKDVHGFKTYEEYKDEWIYQWTNGIPWVAEKPWRYEGCCNGGDLPGIIRFGNSIHFQDYEWYEGVEDGELKKESLKEKAILEDNDDDIEDLDDYLIWNDDPYYVDEEEKDPRKGGASYLELLT
nr:hypothetical protein [Tanacetum cinerariifolium]